jgi:hypothetical protein
MDIRAYFPEVKSANMNQPRKRQRLGGSGGAYYGDYAYSKYASRYNGIRRRRKTNKFNAYRKVYAPYRSIKPVQIMQNSVLVNLRHHAVGILSMSSSKVTGNLIDGFQIPLNRPHSNPFDNFTGFPVGYAINATRYRFYKIYSTTVRIKFTNSSAGTRFHWVALPTDFNAGAVLVTKSKSYFGDVASQDNATSFVVDAAGTESDTYTYKATFSIPGILGWSKARYAYSSDTEGRTGSTFYNVDVNSPTQIVWVNFLLLATSTTAAGTLTSDPLGYELDIVHSCRFYGPKEDINLANAIGDDPLKQGAEPEGFEHLNIAADY